MARPATRVLTVPVQLLVVFVAASSSSSTYDPFATDNHDSTDTGLSTISLTAAAPPSLIVANDKYLNASKNGTYHQAHFAQTLARFPSGQLFTNFQTVCDVCVPHRTWPGRSFFSVDNGSSWEEIPQPLGAYVFKNCIPISGKPNSIKCFAYPLSISNLTDNTTGHLLMSEFEADTKKVRQVAVTNATMGGWPGLIPFDVTAPMRAGVAPGNWYMVQDGNPMQTKTGKWLLPFYGLLQQPKHGTGAPSPAPIAALVSNTDDTLERWKFYSLVNNGGDDCDVSDPRARPAPWTTGRCDPTEGALTRLADGKILYVWRNDPGYNISLMGQVSADEGLTWSKATPLNGPPVDDDRWGEPGGKITKGPFGVEPKLAMLDSGVLFLSTGRPRIYVWGLPKDADPLKDKWQPFDLGAIHNASIARAGGSDAAGIPEWPAEFWTLWKAPDPHTGLMHPAGCCTTSYTGLVALPRSNELVVTYDMIARECPRKMCLAHPGLPCGCDFIVSMRLMSSGGAANSVAPASTPKNDATSSLAHFVAYSSRLPRNGTSGVDGFNWTQPCFLAGGNTFAAAVMDWVGAGIDECMVDDPPLRCFTDPQSVKACLDRMPRGRKVIHLQGGIWLYGNSSKSVRKQCGGWADFDPILPGACTLWSDRWQGIVSRRISNWMASYKDLGGTIDVIMIDFETNPWWEPGDFYHNRTDFGRTLADPRWPAVLAQLNEHGQKYGVNFNNISDIMWWGSSRYDGDFRKYVWTAVMNARRGAYLNRTLFNPVRKYFPNVKGSDYNHHMHPGPDDDRWEGVFTDITTPPVCCGSHVGTHGSQAYYGETALQNGAPSELAWVTPASTDGRIPSMNITASTTPFNMLLSYIRRARGQLLAIAPTLVPLMPWVEPKNSSWYSKYCHTAPCGSNHSVLALDGAFEEMIFHLGLSGVTEFLWYRAGDEWPWYRAGDEWPTEGIGHFSGVLSELDLVVGRAASPSNAMCLKTIISIKDNFLLSGHPSQLPNASIFRFSPRDFSGTIVLRRSPATFQLSNGSRVVPVPGGQILDLANSVGTNGYWIVSDGVGATSTSGCPSG